MALWIVRARLELENSGKEWVYLVKAVNEIAARAIVRNDLAFPNLDFGVSEVPSFVVKKLLGYSSWGVNE